MFTALQNVPLESLPEVEETISFLHPHSFANTSSMPNDVALWPVVMSVVVVPDVLLQK